MKIKKLNKNQMYNLLIEIDNFVGNIEQEIKTGIFLFRGYRIQVSKYKQTNAQRVNALYERRRNKGLCIRCGVKVTEINSKTKQKYKTCSEHREKPKK